MPAGKHKSRTYRRKYVRVPSGSALHYVKRKPKIAHCSICKKPLHGIPRGRPYQIRKLPKTQRRPERPYPELCSRCARQKIKEQLR